MNLCCLGKILFGHNVLEKSGLNDKSFKRIHAKVDFYIIKLSLDHVIKS